MKKLFLLTVLLGSLLLPSSLKAYDFEEGGIYYKILSREYKTVAVTYGVNDYLQGNTYHGEINIPDVVRDYKVTTIGAYAFYKCEDVTSVTLGNSIQTIEQSAFTFCSGITSIDIPQSVSFIEYFTFNRCNSLLEINVSDQNSYYTSIDGVLYDKDVKEIISFPGGKTSVTIPESISIINASAFSMCVNLESVVIPESVTLIDNGAFVGCSSLPSIVIPDSVVKMGSDMFWGCTSLEDLTIGSEIKEMEVGTFNDCISLTKVTCRAPEPPNCYFPPVVPIESATLYVPYQSLEKYKTTSPWKNFGTIIPFGEAGMISINSKELDSVSIYGINGLKVEENKDNGSINNLPAGLYIVNGKKIIVK